MFSTDPDNIHVTVRADHRSARVKWVTQSQEECSGVVINYTVFYGTQGGPSLSKPSTDLYEEIDFLWQLHSWYVCDGFLLDVTVNSGNQDVVLIDLNPNTKYEIYINATASTGTSKSNTISFTTNIFGKYNFERDEEISGFQNKCYTSYFWFHE